MSAEPLVSVRGLGMAFGGTTVLRDVDLDLWPGEVHAITGENGAGKSTLAKLIAGVYRPVAGEITVAGRPVKFNGPADAVSAGVTLVHQEPLTFSDLTVAENIFVARQPRNRFGFVSWGEMNRRAEDLLRGLGLKLAPEQRVSGLSIADQQLVEVAAAMAQNARVILLDETTASLSPKEVDELFAVVRRLRDSGVAFAFVNHRLEEVFSICDRISVLRDGVKVGQVQTSESTIPEIVRLMVGRELSETDMSSVAGGGETMLDVQNLRVTGRVENVSFQVAKGEIVALAGLVGAGRTDVAHALFGVWPADSGTIRVNGNTVALTTPQVAMTQGIALVPEDRQHHGLVLGMSIADNATLPILRQMSKLWIQRKAVEDTGETWIEKLGVACRGPRQAVGELSGGNQQKVVIAKALLTKPRLLIIDEPTRGVDVGAKSEVHRLLRELAAEGLAVLMISSDLPEVLSLSDRVLVMREGQIVAEFAHSEATSEAVMFAATGQEAVHA